MRWFQRAGIKIVDLIILTAMLLYIAGHSIGAMTFFQLFVAVSTVYLAVIVIVNILCQSIAGEHPLVRIARTVISGLLVLFLFTWALGPILMLLNTTMTPDAQTILFYGAMARSIARAFLSHHFDSLP